jgi:DNA polymerase elongation subunit (family B)
MEFIDECLAFFSVI